MGCGGTKVANTVQRDAHEPIQVQRQDQRKGSVSSRADSGVSCVDPTPPPSQRNAADQGHDQPTDNNDAAQEQCHQDQEQVVQITTETDQGELREEQVLESTSDSPATPSCEDVKPQETTRTTCDEQVQEPQVTGTRSEYWDDVRGDVSELINDIHNKQEDTRTPGEQQYLALLTRWQEKYCGSDPPGDQSKSGCSLDETVFPLTADADSMRMWVVGWEPFDTTPPPETQPPSVVEVTLELGDTHSTFSATLRTFLNEDVAFRFDINGEAAWDVLPQNAVADDVMTPEQELIHRTREQRTDLHDPERMRRRRERLAEHFIEVREIPAGVVMPFLQWADLLEKNKEELEKLCKE